MRDIAHLRHTLRGTEGAGKTHPPKAFVKRGARYSASRAASFWTHTLGMMRATLDAGPRHLPSCSRQSGSDFAPASGEFLKSHQLQFARRKFLITDAISRAGAQKFSAMSIRAGEANANEISFGNGGVALSETCPNHGQSGRRP